jgi:hypothetical protein
VRDQHLLHGRAEVIVGVNWSSSSATALSSTSGDSGGSGSSSESGIAATGGALGSREAARMELDADESNLGGGGAREWKREGRRRETGCGRGDFVNCAWNRRIDVARVLAIVGE